jgi:hypothetical protein
MQYIEDIGCLTQRSQLDRLQEFADGTTRERVKTLEPAQLLPTTVFVIDAAGKASSWELDHFALARSTPEAVQLALDPDIALTNLVPTQAIMRILRNTAASAVGLVAPASDAAAAFQLADLDHEQSLMARIVRTPEHEPALSNWDFGKVVWTVRLRQVLRAAQQGVAEELSAKTSGWPAVTAAQAVRPADPIASRRNHRREMREQLYRKPAAAPSWLQ